MEKSSAITEKLILMILRRKLMNVGKLLFKFQDSVDTTEDIR